MQSFDWSRGIKRLHYFILAIVWLCTMFIFAVDGSTTAAAFGRVLGALLIFTLCYMLFFSALAWVVRGFLPKK